MPVNVTEYTIDGENWIPADDYGKLSEADRKKYSSYTFETEILSSYQVKIGGEETATYRFSNSGTNAQIDWTELPPTELPFKIANRAGTELPSTGGPGTTAIYLLGILLVMTGGLGLLTFKKRETL